LGTPKYGSWDALIYVDADAVVRKKNVKRMFLKEEEERKKKESQKICDSRANTC
jgi:hypothetical protein